MPLTVTFYLGLHCLEKVPIYLKYCKCENFRENFIFVNSDNMHICHIKNRDFDVIYPHQKTTEWFRFFARFLLSRNFKLAKFHENKILKKIFDFTVPSLQTVYAIENLLSGFNMRPRIGMNHSLI